MVNDSSTTVVVVTGGDPLEGVDLPSVPDGALVVAADSGVDRAHGLGLRVDVAVGDFDSVTDAGLDRAAEAGAKVDRHPEAKDTTDLELALDVARSLDPARIVVLGGHGGRLDHLLANALLLARPALAGIDVVAQMGAARVTVVRSSAELRGHPGDLVTLLPLHGIARGVVTDGLLYPLRDEDLLPGSTRGVSNELVTATAVVTVREGTLLAVQPGLAGTHLLREHP
ncbi:MAG TPA: thiamine diphosphokinase [Acidimicrobiales bacterium]|nr:thiamine diphosphokinase [Acidimicrobiales bacterium]